MLYTIQRLCGKRMAAVLVERRQLAWNKAWPLISNLQMAFQLPVMLVACDNTEWNNVKAVAEFDAIPCLLELLALEHIEWNEEIFSDQNCSN